MDFKKILGMAGMVGGALYVLRITGLVNLENIFGAKS